MSEQEPKKRERQRTPNHRTTTGFRICDELWAVLQALLPVHIIHSFRGGRLRVADGDCADAIFYVLRTGCQLNRFRRLLVGRKNQRTIWRFSILPVV